MHHAQQSVQSVAVQVDLVLLGGDLFHDNKPSRATLVRAIDILRKYCISSAPIAIRVLGDQAAAFVSKCARPSSLLPTHKELDTGHSVGVLYWFSSPVRQQGHGRPGVRLYQPVRPPFLTAAYKVNSIRHIGCLFESLSHSLPCKCYSRDNHLQARTHAHAMRIPVACDGLV